MKIKTRDRKPCDDNSRFFAVVTPEKGGIYDDITDCCHRFSWPLTLHAWLYGIDTSCVRDGTTDNGGIADHLSV